MPTLLPLPPPPGWCQLPPSLLLLTSQHVPAQVQQCQTAPAAQTSPHPIESLVILWSLIHTHTPLTPLCWTQQQALNYDPAEAERLEETRRVEGAAARTAREAVDALAAQLGALDFNYKDPERGWDRSRVKGVRACGAKAAAGQQLVHAHKGGAGGWVGW